MHAESVFKFKKAPNDLFCPICFFQTKRKKSLSEIDGAYACTITTNDQWDYLYTEDSHYYTHSHEYDENGAITIECFRIGDYFINFYPETRYSHLYKEVLVPAKIERNISFRAYIEREWVTNLSGNYLELVKQTPTIEIVEELIANSRIML